MICLFLLMAREIAVQAKGKDEGKMVKTTINLPEKTWQDFSIKVIREQGGRKKNDVIAELIKKYLEED